MSRRTYNDKCENCFYYWEAISEEDSYYNDDCWNDYYNEDINAD